MCSPAFVPNRRLTRAHCSPSRPLAWLPRFRPLAGKKLAQRSAAAQRPDAAEFDYLRDASQPSHACAPCRLNDITRTFPVALDLGANTGNLAKQLDATGAGGISRLYMMDECRA